MLAKVNSCAIVGLDSTIVEVEVDSSRVLSSLTLVGLPGAAVEESAERVRADLGKVLFFVTEPPGIRPD